MPSCGPLVGRAVAGRDRGPFAHHLLASTLLLHDENEAENERVQSVQARQVKHICFQFREFRNLGDLYGRRLFGTRGVEIYRKTFSHPHVPQANHASISPASGTACSLYSCIITHTLTYA